MSDRIEGLMGALEASVAQAKADRRAAEAAAVDKPAKPTTVDQLRALVAEHMPWATVEEIDRPDPDDDGEFVIYTGLRRASDEDGDVLYVDGEETNKLEDMCAEREAS